MSSIRINEINRMKIWAEMNESMSGLEKQRDSVCDSYWNTREQEDTYITEYDFKTIPEFESMCKGIWSNMYDDDIIKIISVSAFKCSPQFEQEKERETEPEESLGRMPEYIYMF